MNRSICLISFMIISLSIKAQLFTDKEMGKYLVAYEYIVKDDFNKNALLCISDTIVDLPRFWFEDSVKKYTEEIHLIEKFRRYDFFDNFYAPELSKLILDNDWGNKDKMIFFSLIEENTLCADLVPIIRHSSDNLRLLGKSTLDYIQKNIKNYQIATMYNTEPIYAYFFIFDEEGNIKFVFKHQMKFWS